MATYKPVPKLHKADIYTVYRPDGSAISSLSLYDERTSIFDAAKHRLEGSLRNSAREMSEDSAMLDLAIRTIDMVQKHLSALMPNNPLTSVQQHEEQRERALGFLAKMTGKGVNLSFMVEPEGINASLSAGQPYSEADVSKTRWPQTSILPTDDVDSDLRAVLDQYAAAAWSIESGKVTSKRDSKLDRTTYIQSGPLTYRRDEGDGRNMFTWVSLTAPSGQRAGSNKTAAGSAA